MPARPMLRGHYLCAQRTAVPQVNAVPGLRPSLLKIMAAGQKPGKAACSMLAPTKAAGSSQQGLTSQSSTRLTSTMVPARANTARSTFTGKSPDPRAGGRSPRGGLDYICDYSYIRNYENTSQRHVGRGG